MSHEIIQEQRDRLLAVFESMASADDRERQRLLNDLEAVLKTGMDLQFVYDNGHSPVGLLIQSPIDRTLKTLALDSMVRAGANPLLLDRPLHIENTEQRSWVIQTMASLAIDGFERYDEQGNNILHLALSKASSLVSAREAFNYHFELSAAGAPPLIYHEGLQKLATHHRHVDGFSPLAVMLYRGSSTLSQYEVSNMARMTHYLVASGARLDETDHDGITVAEKFIALVEPKAEQLKRYPGVLNLLPQAHAIAQEAVLQRDTHNAGCTRRGKRL